MRAAVWMAERMRSGTPLGKSRNRSKLEAVASKADFMLLTVALRL